MTESRATSISSIVFPLINRSCRNIIARIIKRLSTDIGTFNNLIKALGAGLSAKQRQRNSYKFPSHWNLTNFRTPCLAAHWNMHLFNRFCTCSLPSVIRPKFVKVFSLITGLLPPSFFPTRNIWLRNSPSWCETLEIAPFCNISFTSKSISSFWSLFHCWGFWENIYFGSCSRGILNLSTKDKTLMFSK